MEEFLMAAANGRHITKEDKIFGINKRAKKMIAERGKDAVINATIGALLDDSGSLMVLSTVDRTFRRLSKEEYSSYAPIGGTPEFKRAAVKVALRGHSPKGYVRAVASPGGTGAIRGAVANYSSYKDKVLTTDWFWPPYTTICDEMGRSLEVFELFSSDRGFNIESFREKVNEILKAQDRLMIILNTPAHNPTGYSITAKEWEGIADVLNHAGENKKITLLIDAAYMDYAGDELEYREFLPVLDKLGHNVLPLIAYSMSKTFTLYGMRCGALICIAPSEDTANEFTRVVEYSARACWSNSPRAGQSIIARICADEGLFREVSEERKEIRDMLLRRGKAFEETCREAGVATVPFDAGFFVSVPCADSDKICRELENEGVFLIPYPKGIRVSVASVSEDKCRILPGIIGKAMGR